MLLIWACPGGLCWVWGVPGQYIARPGRSGIIRVDTVMGPAWSGVGPGRSVALPWWSWVIRVGSVFIRSAAVLSPG